MGGFTARGDRATAVWAGRCLAVGLIYFAAAKAGLELASTTPSVTAIWPPAGIALAALVLGGPRLWPGVALGAFLANATTDVPLYTAVGITVGNTLAAVVAAHLLRRIGFRASLERLRDLFALLSVSLATPMISATIGVASLSLGDSLSGGGLTEWRLWWLGDFGGDVLVGLLILIAVKQWPYRGLPGRPAEAVALFTGLVSTAVLIFDGNSALAYLTFPFLIWAALRFWQSGAIAAALIAGGIAIAYTANDKGQFVQASQDESLLLAVIFSVVSALTALVLAILTKQRRRGEEAMRAVAHRLQVGMLPPTIPTMKDMEAAAWYRAAEREQEVGGDFYDLFGTPDGDWVALIGDVCGKGPEAASLTALARYTLRAVARQPLRPSEVLRDLNRTILEQRGDGRFMTVALARISSDGDGRRLTVSNGGHPLPLVLRADGRVDEVGQPGGGTLLGVLADPQLRDESILLETGDALVLFTDGLVERAEEPERGQTWMLDALKGLGAQPAERVVEALRSASQALAGPINDDVAILVLRVY